MAHGTKFDSRTAGLRVAIVADNASFRFGGEASLPLHYFSRLRQRGVEAWLVVHGRTREELAALFPNDGDRILTVRDRWFHKLLWWPSYILPRRLYGVTFGTAMETLNQLLQRRMVKRLVREHDVNVVHQPTSVSPKAPSCMAGLDTALVIGPMNGGMEYPQGFAQHESRVSRAVVALGRCAANVVNRIFSGKAEADILLVANQRTWRALPTCAKGRVVELAENGVDLNIWKLPQRCEERLPQMPPRFLFVGRLVDWKRLDIALHALAKLPAATLDVIGDGATRDAWAELAVRLGITDRVNFLGWLPQAACARLMHNATALLLPSIFECGGAVVLEAMATGTPVIATDWGGPADYLDSDCGMLVSPESADQMAEGFAAAMFKLAANPDLREAFGKAGRQRVERHYDWEKKIDRVLEIYAQAIAAHTRHNGRYVPPRPVTDLLQPISDAA